MQLPRLIQQQLQQQLTLPNHLMTGKLHYGCSFILAFGAGLIAILTPCVFPMIPMTVSYFMKSGSNGKIQASIYGFSIIAIYTLFGTVVAVLFGAEFSNWISTHWIPNVLFFLIFVIFAASFFGYFEITMPNWLVNKSVSAEDKGGTIGTVFMAFTLVLVSFSCTGPIVGTILVESVGGQILKPIIGMLGFSLAFAIPFTLFALFPQWLNKMPKSGGWLNTVKVVLGFIELAFALKFLNIPDQTYHWGILDREIYLGFWIVIFTMMGFYLLGKNQISARQRLSGSEIISATDADYCNFHFCNLPDSWFMGCTAKRYFGLAASDGNTGF